MTCQLLSRAQTTAVMHHTTRGAGNWCHGEWCRKGKGNNPCTALFLASEKENVKLEPKKFPRTEFS